MPGLLMLMAIFMFGTEQLGIALDKLLVQLVPQDLLELPAQPELLDNL
jgi:hypothetical protein